MIIIASSSHPILLKEHAANGLEKAPWRGNAENRELKQTRRGRKRERRLKMQLRVSAIIFQLFKVIMMLEKCLLTVLELIWNQRLGHKKTKLNICHNMLTSSTQLQNMSFHVVVKTRTSSKCQKMKNARAKRAKYCFRCQICNLWGFCCRRRRGCLSSLIKDFLLCVHVVAKTRNLEISRCHLTGYVNE